MAFWGAKFCTMAIIKFDFLGNFLFFVNLKAIVKILKKNPNF
jgi:uncharacterized protein YneF (UPF0154 family)